MAEQLERVVAWRNLLINGTDYCALWRIAKGWLLRGTVVGALENQRPMLANYEVHCDDNWLTRRVQVERTIGRRHENAQPERGEWWPMAKFGAGIARGARLSGC